MNAFNIHMNSWNCPLAAKGNPEPINKQYTQRPIGSHIGDNNNKSQQNAVLSISESMGEVNVRLFSQFGDV